MSRTAVIILNWNGCELMRRYLPEVLANSTSSDPTHTVDVIVADNASTDGSIDMLKAEFPQVSLILLDKNYGFAEGYNRALRQVDHDYVVLLNSDVAPAAGWLEPLIALMERESDVAACGPKLRDDKRHEAFEYAGAAGGYVDWLGYPMCRGRVMDTVEEDQGQYDSEANVLWQSGAALMVRRELYNDMGGLDADFFAHMEEIDLCWRMRNAGWRIVTCPSSTVYHLGGATLSATNPRKTYLNFRNNLTMLIKNYNGSRWVWVFALRLLLDGLAGVRYLIGLEPRFCWAIVRAHWYLWTHWHTIMGKRNMLAPLRGESLAPEILRFSLLWRYYARGERTYGEMTKKQLTHKTIGTKIGQQKPNNKTKETR